MHPKAFQQDGVPTIKPTDVLAVPNARLIDVRMPEEFVGELGHIAGAKLVTLGPELEEFLATAEKKAPVIFLCRSGARSARATMAALHLGFSEPYNMEGGMMLWNAEGRPVTR
jgi:hydroxyacylglutathione hydrolase